VSSPDYVNTDRDHAIEDFRRRINLYEVNYETLDVDHDRHLSFIKIFNQGDKYLVNGVRGQSVLPSSMHHFTYQIEPYPVVRQGRVVGLLSFGYKTAHWTQQVSMP